MYHLRIELPGLPQLQSGAFGHWSARRRHDSRWKQLVALEARGHWPKEPLERASLVCTRFSCARSSPDRDNLVASFKPLIDALQGVVIKNDSPEHMTAEYHWEKCHRGEGRVVIEVSEVGDE